MYTNLIKMKFNLCFFLSFILYNLPLSISSEKGLGKCSCGLVFFAELCNKQPPSIHDLPNECTSFILDGFQMDATGIQNPYRVDSKKFLSVVVSGTNKPIYAYFFQTTYESWSNELDVDGANAKARVKFLEEFVNTYKISGIIFKYFLTGIDYRPPADFAKRINTYISTLKAAVKTIEYGVVLDGGDLINNEPLLEFGQLTALDFYVIETESINDCTSKNRDGLVPLKSTDASIKSLEMFKDKVIPNMKFDKSKIFFNFPLMPTMPANGNDDPFCTQRYENLCSDKEKTKNWCSDTSCTWAEKGKFASEFGGAIGGYLDLDDSNNLCQCKNKFSAFYFLNDGVQNIPVDASACPKFNRA